VAFLRGVSVEVSVLSGVEILDWLAAFNGRRGIVFNWSACDGGSHGANDESKNGGWLHVERLGFFEGGVAVDGGDLFVSLVE
jgi:hypothetical protein